jgi:hypothetical protein
MSRLAEDLAKLPKHQLLPEVMSLLETLLTVIPVDELRALVAKGEAVYGRGNPQLPSGGSFDKLTRRGRLWLDLIDAMEELAKE